MKNPADIDLILFDQDAPDDASEYVRQSLLQLNNLQLAPILLNLNLVYAHVAGKNEHLNERLDSYLSGDQEWSHEEAKKLFLRFLYKHQDAVLDGVQAELIDVVAHILGTVTDIAGQSALVSERLQKRIDQLAASGDPAEVLEIGSAILRDTRGFVTATKQFESDVSSSSGEIQRLREELNDAKRASYTDALTGLNNRRGFDKQLDYLLEDRRRKASSFSLLLADLDDFKQVNDELGHITGDKVLKVVAETVTQQIRAGDYAARYGGEEFAILLPGTNATDALKIGEKIRSTVEKLRLVNTKSGNAIGTITISIGIAEHLPDEAGTHLIDRADAALYAAKQKGKNRALKD